MIIFPLAVSVTLAALLTVILLPWAFLTARRSVPLAAMTLAMLLMTWRGETWKYGCPDLEARVSQLPPQCLQLLPKTAFSDQAAELGYDDRRCDADLDNSAERPFLQPPHGSYLDGHEWQHALLRSSRNRFESLLEKSLTVYLVLLPPNSARICSHPQGISLGLELPYSTPTSTAVALHFGVYNFVWIHKMLGTTPAVAAGIELERWSLEQVVEMTAEYLRRKEDAKFEEAFAKLEC